MYIYIYIYTLPIQKQKSATMLQKQIHSENDQTNDLIGTI